jgi:hypothetical protein
VPMVPLRKWWRRRSVRIGLGALSLLVVAALVVVVVSGRSPSTRYGQGVTSAALPPSSATSPSMSPSSAVAAPPKCGPRTPAADGVTPVYICIPVIGVNATVLQLGLNADGTVQVPPLSEVGVAGWYRNSPPPGEDGPTIILGHINSAQYGPGVFLDLGHLRSGDAVNVARGDGAVATFRITRVAEYPKSAFPTQLVYGDTAGPTIRLITCGGTFDPHTGSYKDNIVAFGELTSIG